MRGTLVKKQQRHVHRTMSHVALSRPSYPRAWLTRDRERGQPAESVTQSTQCWAHHHDNTARKQRRTGYSVIASAPCSTAVATSLCGTLPTALRVSRTSLHHPPSTVLFSLSHTTPTTDVNSDTPLTDKTANKKLLREMLFLSTRVLRKQTKNPPKKFTPIDQNPLARWSKALPKWSQLAPCMPNTHVGLEGCNSAFNATNSIRTCLFFSTSAPPCFLSVTRWADIEHVQTRADSETLPSTAHGPPSSFTEGTTVERHFQGAEMKDLALFGEDAFLHPDSLDGLPPLVAVENFTSRSESMFRRRFPRDGWRMVVGHENWGVRSEFIHGVAQQGDHRPRLATSVPMAPTTLKADAVLYVPQYGTISSLNVVTSLGVALFYAFLDQCFPESRTLVSDHLYEKADADTAERTGALTLDDLLRYQRQFTSALPEPLAAETTPHTSASMIATTSEGTALLHRNTSPRVDARPIHPLFYHGDKLTIRQRHERHRDALLAFSRPDASPEERSRRGFGLSVLYENEFDQRNFGGLIRNANGFLVDHIFYVGRRKFNVVGAVGSNHYTPPKYLGPCCSVSDASETHHADITEWSEALRHNLDAASGGASLRWWLLDLGHGQLYEDEQPRSTAAAVAAPDGSARHDYYSSAASLQWYRERLADPNVVLTLCDTEEALAAATSAGVLLVVPQEGKLPHEGILRHCERILRVIPDSHSRSLAGLPSQVASGIALQRLSVVQHPRLRVLS